MMDGVNRSSPQIVPGFQDFSLFWEPRWNCYAVKVKPGEFYIARSNMVLTTVLGSCISACIYDPQAGYGGMNHFMLPASHANAGMGRSLRYGLFAMEQLINELMKHGCSRERMQVKLAGGGEMMRGYSTVGQQNINFITQYIQDEGLNLLADDLGGDRARRVAYFPTEGRMLVNKLDHREDQRLIEEERSYSIDVDQHMDDSEVELF